MTAEQPRPVWREGARPDLPFAEMAPHDLHRLVLHLLHRSEEYRDVEDFGGSGEGDGGIDITARVHGTNVAARVAVQVKRVRAFTKTHAKRELARLAASGAHRRFDEYLLAVSCTPSVAALELLESGCNELGFSTVHVWSRTTLTARTLEHPDVLRIFFGVSSFAADDEPAAARVATLRRSLAAGHPILLVLGSQADDALFEGGLPDAGATSLDILRRLLQAGGACMAMAQGTRLVAEFGDLVVISHDDHFPGRHRLWHLTPSDDLGARIAEAAAAVSQDGSPPVVIAFGLAQDQVELIEAHRGHISEFVVENGVLVVGHAAATSDGAPTPLPPISVLQIADRIISRLWLLHRTTRVRFDIGLGPIAALHGLPTGPEVACWGQWENILPDYRQPTPGRTTRPICISDSSGTGKTSTAYYIGYTQSPTSTHYLDLLAVEGVTAQDLHAVYSWLQVHEPGATLIIDNAQAASHETHRFLSNHQHERPLVQLVVVELIQAGSVGDQPSRDRSLQEEWSAQRWALVTWAQDKLADVVSEGALQRASQEAENFWHFMYLLRHGMQQLTRELKEARSAADSDLVWLAVAAVQTFERTYPDTRQIHRWLTDHELWPLAVTDRDRGAWLTEALQTLADQHRLLARGTRWVCRHPLEALAVIRFSFDQDRGATQASVKDAIVAAFCVALKPVEVPASWDTEAPLTKASVRTFANERIRRSISIQRELERAVSADSRLQSHVDKVWAPVVRLIERWPTQAVYWLFTGLDFSWTFLRFSPFLRLRRLDSLARIRTTSEVMEFSYMVRGVLALDTLETEEPRQAARFMLRIFDEFLLTPATTPRAVVEERAEILATQLDSYLNASPDVDDEEAEEVDDQNEADAASDPSDDNTENAEVSESEAFLQLRYIIASSADGAEDLAPTDQLGGAFAVGDSPADRALRVCAVMLTLETRSVASGLDLGSAEDMRAQFCDLNPAARSLALAHLWLLSPTFGADVLASWPVSWQQHLIEDIKRASANFSRFHLRSDSAPLTLFTAAASLQLPALGRWLDSPASGILGHRCRAVLGWGDFDDRGLQLGATTTGLPDAS